MSGGAAQSAAGIPGEWCDGHGVGHGDGLAQGHVHTELFEDPHDLRHAESLAAVSDLPLEAADAESPETVE